jgi:hypothetical protein
MTSTQLPAATMGKLGWPVIDQRREPRSVCRGEIRITLDKPRPLELDGELADISNHGFRALYVGKLLPRDTKISFRHRFFSGKARVMWSRQLPDFSEIGCMVERD